MRGDPVGQLQVLSQPGFFALAKDLNFDLTVRPTNNGTDRHEKQIQELVPDVLFPWVFHRPKVFG